MEGHLPYPEERSALSAPLRGPFLTQYVTDLIAELFLELNLGDRAAVLSRLALLIATPVPNLANRVSNPRGPVGGPLDVQGSREPCEQEGARFSTTESRAPGASSFPPFP
jgi:hypothetical protein